MKLLRKFLLWVWRWWTGKILGAKLSDKASPERSEAELAVARIVASTDLSPDVVAATTLKGGPAIVVRVDGCGDYPPTFIHHSYAQAADEVIRWARREHRSTGQASKMNRHQRRQFDKLRRKERK